MDSFPSTRSFYECERGHRSAELDTCQLGCHAQGQVLPCLLMDTQSMDPSRTSYRPASVLPTESLCRAPPSPPLEAVYGESTCVSLHLCSPPGSLILGSFLLGSSSPRYSFLDPPHLLSTVLSSDSPSSTSRFHSAFDKNFRIAC